QGHRVEMPHDVLDQTVSRQQRRDQEQKRPRREQRRFDEFPLEDRLRRERQREQKAGFAIPKKVRVADDQIADQQKQKQKREQQKEQPFHKKRSDSRKLPDKAQANVKQPKCHDEITGDKKRNHCRQQTRLLPHSFEPPPTRKQIDPQQQRQRSSRRRVLRRGAGHGCG